MLKAVCILLNAGLRLKGVMDLVFSPQQSSGGHGEGEALWLDPLVRWAAAALLDSYSQRMCADRWHLPACSTSLDLCLKEALKWQSSNSSGMHVSLCCFDA